MQGLTLVRIRTRALFIIFASDHNTTTIAVTVPYNSLKSGRLFPCETHENTSKTPNKRFKVCYKACERFFVRVHGKYSGRMFFA